MALSQMPSISIYMYHTYYTSQPLKSSLMVTISTYGSGGGLIIYQAYGNLYAMNREAHLLEGKQIPSVGHLKDIWWEYDDFGTVLEENGQGSQRVQKLMKNCIQNVEMLFGNCETPSGFNQRRRLDQPSV
ncbi:hypothetical protein Tco_0936388 [Tanacetum coccineum]